MAKRQTRATASLLDYTTMATATVDDGRVVVMVNYEMCNYIVVHQGANDGAFQGSVLKRIEFDGVGEAHKAALDMMVAEAVARTSYEV